MKRWIALKKFAWLPVSIPGHGLIWLKKYTLIMVYKTNAGEYREHSAFIGHEDPKLPKDEV